MGFLSKLFGPLFGRAPSGSDRYLPLYALSHRCREAVAGQIDLMNEVSLDDEGSGGYYVRKVLHTSGRNRCFAEVEIEVWLDSRKRVERYEVHGGRWLTADEYEAELEREKAEQEAAEQEAQQSAAQAADETDSQQEETR